MAGPIGRRILVLAWVAILSALASRAVEAAQPPKQAPKSAKPAAPKPDNAALFSLPGEDPTPAFIPKIPRSVEDQRQIEAVRDYSAARALEDQRAWSESIALLEEALKLEPESVAILR